MLVFVYGTLKQGDGNHRVLGDSKFIGVHSGKVPYQMYDCGYFPALVPSKKTQYFVSGEVYEVDAKTMKQLDHLEGYPMLYKKGFIKTKYGKATVYYMEKPDKYMEPISSGIWNDREHDY